MEFHERTCFFCINIIRLDSQSAVQYRFFFGKTSEMMITERDLLQREAVARVQINCALQTAHRLFLFALAPLDVTF